MCASIQKGAKIHQGLSDYVHSQVETKQLGKRPSSEADMEIDVSPPRQLYRPRWLYTMRTVL